MCCAGTDMELMEGAFLSASFSVFCLFSIQSVECYVNDRNIVQKVDRKTPFKQVFIFLAKL